MAPPKPKGSGFGHWLAKLGTRLHILIYRLSGGRIGGTAFNSPVLLLTSRGAKTGKKRTVAILYLKTDDGYAVVASYGGADKHPAWFVNLRNDPNAEIQAGAQSFKVLSRIATRDENAELWPKLTAMYPDYQVYQDRSARDIPVVLLSPTS